MDPPVYLLDEPTSALDSDTEQRVMKQFTTLAREKKKQLSSSHTHNNFQKKLRTILLRLVKQTVQLERKCSQLKSVIELQIWQLAAAYIFILILIGLVKLKGIPREKQIALATFRMTIQISYLLPMSLHTYLKTVIHFIQLLSLLLLLPLQFLIFINELTSLCPKN